MKSQSTFFLDQLGIIGKLPDTAIDDVSFNPCPQKPGVLYDPHGAKPLFTASFPISNEPGWMKELQNRRRRDLGDTYEVKWKWFEQARNSLEAELLTRVYSGLGEATIFINDLHPFIEENTQFFLNAGFSKTDISHPFFKKEALSYATESLLWNTPAWDVHEFDPSFLRPGFVSVDTEESEFEPKKYLQKITTNDGKISPQNATLLAAEIQAGFQEVLIPEIWDSIWEHFCQTTRYLLPHEGIMRSYVVLSSLVPKRKFDGGNKKVSKIIEELRTNAKEKIKKVFCFEYPEFEYDNLGITEHDCDSSESFELQMADLASGYAEELFRKKYQGNKSRLLENFKCVLYNGKLVTK